MAWAWFLINLLVTVPLAASSLWGKPSRDKKLAILVGVLLGASVIGQKMITNRTEQEESERQSVIIRELKNTNSLLGKREAAANELIQRLEKEVRSQSLKQEAQNFVLGIKMDAVTRRIDQTSQGALGRDGLGRAPLGGRPSALDRVADTLNDIHSRYLSRVEVDSIYQNTFKDQRELFTEYITAVEKIPAFYSEEEWKETEGRIFTSLVNDILHNYSRRGLSRGPMKDGHVASFRKEREKYLKARARSLQSKKP